MARCTCTEVVPDGNRVAVACVRCGHMAASHSGPSGECMVVGVVNGYCETPGRSEYVGPYKIRKLGGAGSRAVAIVQRVRSVVEGITNWLRALRRHGPRRTK